MRALVLIAVAFVAFVAFVVCAATHVTWWVTGPLLGVTLVLIARLMMVWQRPVEPDQPGDRSFEA